MPVYHFFRDGGREAGHQLICETDESAIALAQKMTEGAVRTWVWECSRFLGSFPHNSSSERFRLATGCRAIAAAGGSPFQPLASAEGLLAVSGKQNRSTREGEAAD